MQDDFQVGERYENRAFEYEVLDINRMADWMLIRNLKTQEEMETSISLQARIQMNMGFEEDAAEKRARKRERRFLSGYGDDLEGLTETDFQRSITGTHWRARSYLAGAVAKALSKREDDNTFTSWAVPRTPVAYFTHMDSIKKKTYEQHKSKARLTVEVDEEAVYFGLYIRKKDGPMDDEWDWLRLIEALRDDQEIQEVLDEAREEFAADVIARRTTEDEELHFVEGASDAAEPLWSLDDQPDTADIADALDGISTDEWGEFYIIQRVEKEDVLAMEPREQVNMIASFFEVLMPIYEAAADM